jgi:uncharacterized lipoprotein YmbA
MKIQIEKTGLLVVLAAAWLMIPGCSLKKQPPELQYYVLGATRDQESIASVGEISLGVRGFRVSPLFERSNFVYQRTDVKYESDYYHQFLIRPAQQITVSVLDWLSDSGLFSHVAEFASATNITHVLEGRVNALYADYRDREAPRAVLEIEFFLVEEPMGLPRLMFHNRYREEISFASGDREAMVAAWNAGLKKILTDLESDIDGLEFEVIEEE